MALNINTQDLESYPGNVKRVTVDQESLVPQGEEGNEQYMLSFSTTAYSDNTARTRIQDMYITSFRAGWCKSSGFVGDKFALDNTHKSLEIRVDATTSGLGDGYYRITLEHDNGLQIDAEVVAADIEAKIRALSLSTADTGYNMAYINSSVEFKNGRFWIVSGSIGEYYSGANRSSVKVRVSSLNDCSAMLGFDLNIDSEIIDGVSVQESLVLTDYVASSSGVGSITISANIGAVVNDCMSISDDTNTEYFQIDSVIGGTVITFDRLKVVEDYTALETKVQLLREQDPDADPTLWFNDIDKINRHGIKSIINQIDYSS